MTQKIDRDVREIERNWKETTITNKETRSREKNAIRKPLLLTFTLTSYLFPFYLQDSIYTNTHHSRKIPKKDNLPGNVSASSLVLV